MSVLKKPVSILLWHRLRDFPPGFHWVWAASVICNWFFAERFLCGWCVKGCWWGRPCCVAATSLSCLVPHFSLCCLTCAWTRIKALATCLHPRFGLFSLILRFGRSFPPCSPLLRRTILSPAPSSHQNRSWPVVNPVHLPSTPLPPLPRGLRAPHQGLPYWPPGIASSQNMAPSHSASVTGAFFFPVKRENEGCVCDSGLGAGQCTGVPIDSTCAVVRKELLKIRTLRQRKSRRIPNEVNVLFSSTTSRNISLQWIIYYKKLALGNIFLQHRIWFEVKRFFFLQKGR